MLCNKHRSRKKRLVWTYLVDVGTAKFAAGITGIVLRVGVMSIISSWYQNVRRNHIFILREVECYVVEI